MRTGALREFMAESGMDATFPVLFHMFKIICSLLRVFYNIRSFALEDMLLFNILHKMVLQNIHRSSRII